MRRAARTDDNHAEIAAAFRAFGWDVHHTYQLGGGFPDLVAYKGGWGIRLIEVKDGRKPPSARKLTKDEREFAKRFPVTIVESVDDVIALNGSSEWARNHCS